MLYDAHANRVVTSQYLPSALHCIAITPLGNLICTGSSSGHIYLTEIASLGEKQSNTSNVISSKNNTPKHVASTAPTQDTDLPYIFQGHRGTVTGLAVTTDSCTLISCALDGALRLWDLWTRVPLRETFPLGKVPLSNISVRNERVRGLNNISMY